MNKVEAVGDHKSAKAVDPAQNSYNYLYPEVVKIPLKFLDPDRRPDHHQNLIRPPKTLPIISRRQLSELSCYQTNQRTLYVADLSWR